MLKLVRGCTVVMGQCSDGKYCIGMAAVRELMTQYRAWLSTGARSTRRKVWEVR